MASSKQVMDALQEAAKRQLAMNQAAKSLKPTLEELEALAESPGQDKVGKSELRRVL